MSELTLYAKNSAYTLRCRAREVTSTMNAFWKRPTLRVLKKAGNVVFSTQDCIMVEEAASILEQLTSDNDRLRKAIEEVKEYLESLGIESVSSVHVVGLLRNALEGK